MTAELSCGRAAASGGQRRNAGENTESGREHYSPKAGLFPRLNHNCSSRTAFCLPWLCSGAGGAVCVAAGGEHGEARLTGCPQEVFRASFTPPSSPPKDEARPRERSGFWGSSILHPGTSPPRYTQQRNLQVPVFQFSGKHHTPPRQRGKQCLNGSSGNRGLWGQQPYLRCPRD